MRVPESWLRAYCDPAISSEALADGLTMAGLEVEEAEAVAPAFSGVVVAKVLAVEPHPNADRLRVCTVDAGGDAPRTIVCGAPNVAVGMTVPCAVPGAVLPGGLTIKDAALRGVPSSGMLCSARELGLSDDHAGLMPLSSDLVAGTDFRAALQLDEQVMTLKLTPNRADCLSILGVAREVAAMTGAPLCQPEFKPVPAVIDDVLPVKVDADDLCGRFAGRIIRGVNPAAPTPDWMKQRLERAGQRSITALVDISNYVMLELGRPSHVFDLDKVQGGLTVRWAKDGETLKLLNGQTVTLDPWFGVISDDHGPESLAGIMGGDSTAVGDDTRNVYVEAAFWWPDSIRGRARRLNFSTDAGHRFERGVCHASTVDHLEYLSALILQICGGQPGPVTDQVLGAPKREPVRLRSARCAKVIGVPVSPAQIASAFDRLGLSYQTQGDDFIVTPPSYRFDIEIEEDLIEEVARSVGFDNIPADPPRAAAIIKLAPESRRSTMQLRDRLVTAGYFEVLSFAFVDKDLEADFAAPGAEPVTLLNPIASQLSTMRSSLVGSLVQVLKSNLGRQATQARIFEIARVFRRDAAQADAAFDVAGIHQPTKVAGLAWGLAAPESWEGKGRQVDYFDVKADVEGLLRDVGLASGVSFRPSQVAWLHPGRSAEVVVDGKVLGVVGAMHPALVQKYELGSAPVVFELDLASLLTRPVPVFAAMSKFPAIVRDLAVVVDASVAAGDLLAAIERIKATQAGKVLQEVKLFDQYRGQGIDSKEKSLAFRILLQDTDKTLSDADADAFVQKVLDALGASFAARLR